MQQGDISEQTRLNDLATPRVAKITYPLYPHQRDAIMGHLRTDVVVAQERPGKPRVSSPNADHLADDARRAKEEEARSNSERPYVPHSHPMNALVADQVSRLRTRSATQKWRFG